VHFQKNYLQVLGSVKINFKNRFTSSFLRYLATSQNQIRQ